MIVRQAGIAMLAILSVFRVEASGIDFRLSSETAEISFLSETATFGYGGADIGFGAFISDDDATNSDALLGNASILVSGSTDGDVRALQFGVGVKAYAGSIDAVVDDYNGAGIGLGGQVRYVFPSNTPVAVLFEGWVVPEVVSMGDFEGITEFRVAVELEVTPSARGYIGYRNLEVELENISREAELDDHVHVGVKFSF